MSCGDQVIGKAYCANDHVADANRRSRGRVFSVAAVAQTVGAVAQTVGGLEAIDRDALPLRAGESILGAEEAGRL